MSGCGKNPPAKPVDSVPSQSALTPTTPVTPADSTIKVTPAPEAPVASPTSPVRSKSFAEAAFLPDDVVGLVVMHPRRITEWPMYRSFQAAGLMKDIDKQLESVKIKPEAIERATLVIDQSSVAKAAGAAGVDVETAEPTGAEAKSRQAKNNLKQLGLAFHNYHSVYNSFPRADGDGEGTKTGLSWRVHLLPLIEQSELYEQFHLDEPWDSEHNKTLIEKMPAAFESPGVTEAGKTAVHVFAGEGTPFNGDKGISLADITDGSSNTILSVVAGADTADIWTKPGGLKFDADAPKKALGDVGDTFLVLMCDGSVHPISKEIDDLTLAHLIQLNDGKAVDFARERQSEPAPFPTVILTLATAADRAAIVESILKTAEEESYEGQTVYKNDSGAVCFVDDKTVLCGTLDAVKQMIATHKAGNAGSSDIAGQLESSADISLVFDLKSQSALMGQAAMLNPMLGLLQQIQSVALQVNVTGNSGDKLIELVATALDDQIAGALSKLASDGLAQGKQTLASIPLGEDVDKSLQDMVREIVRSAEIRNNGDRIEFLIPVPEGFDTLPKLLEPAMKKAASAAVEMNRQNKLKQIGLAFHNHHDTHGKLPGAGRSANDKDGLSWRVHLLPWLDQLELYNEFNLDEPWDSETNKALIEKMPDMFKFDDATPAGKTSVHLFTGTGTPFDKDQTPKFAEFTDGLSNTILAVVAGPATAEIWTKPGGLELDPENPVKTLGNIGQTFLVLLGDGAVRSISKSIDLDTLRRLIQFADGEAVGEF